MAVTNKQSEAATSITVVVAGTVRPNSLSSSNCRSCNQHNFSKADASMALMAIVVVVTVATATATVNENNVIEDGAISNHCRSLAVDCWWAESVL